MHSIVMTTINSYHYVVYLKCAERIGLKLNILPHAHAYLCAQTHTMPTVEAIGMSFTLIVVIFS